MRRTLTRLLVALGTPLALWPWIVRLPPGGIEDDGYFYALIAYNAGVHGMFSFDGIHPTDGFHMVWGYLLAGGSYLLAPVTESRSAHLYLACAISVAAIAAVADRFGRRVPDKVLVFGLGMMGTLLMETPLLALLAIALVLGTIPPVLASRSDMARYLLLSMAITATRIDAIVIPLTWAGCLLVMRRRRPAIAAAAGALLGGVLQASLNRLTAGEWMSVAVVVKAWRTAALDRGLLSLPQSYVGRNVLLVVLLGTSLLAVWRQARAAGDRRWLFAWLAMASFTVPHFLAGMRPWYFVPGYLGCTALLIAVRDGAAPATARMARAGLIAAWLGLAGFVVTEARAGMRYAEEGRAIRDFVRDLQQVVPPGEPIYQVDGAGYIGFFSERPVVNGDGLVNTHEYAERMKQGRLAGYLDEEGIDFIVTNRAGMTDPVNHGGLLVTRAAVEEVGAKGGPEVNRFTNFRLFRRK